MASAKRCRSYGGTVRPVTPSIAILSCHRPTRTRSRAGQKSPPQHRPDRSPRRPAAGGRGQQPRKNEQVRISVGLSRLFIVGGVEKLTDLLTPVPTSAAEFGEIRASGAPPGLKSFGDLEAALEPVFRRRVTVSSRGGIMSHGGCRLRRVRQSGHRKRGLHGQRDYLDPAAAIDPATFRAIRPAVYSLTARIQSERATASSSGWRSGAHTSRPWPAPVSPVRAPTSTRRRRASGAKLTWTHMTADGRARSPDPTTRRAKRSFARRLPRGVSTSAG